jgi:formylglycine-generating enzyme required for sulfatase activity
MPVGSLKPNAFGLYDTLGNAAEWTLDCQSIGYRDTPTDGSANQRGGCGSRIARGGSWFAGEKDTRLSARLVLPVAQRNEMTGFRVVREVGQ